MKAKLITSDSATTIPHLALLNLDVKNKEYTVIWEFNNKIGKWTVSFEEAELVNKG
ncbi:MAG: hypothetical protein GTO02_17835 [Candidatus Dadabacteria bacterium]|nr:hypothetical protein [Candidatus Dadabacteria bacterium]